DRVIPFCGIRAHILSLHPDSLDSGFRCATPSRLPAVIRHSGAAQRNPESRALAVVQLACSGCGGGRKHDSSLASKPVGELVSPSAVPSNPNSRLGRKEARLGKDGTRWTRSLWESMFRRIGWTCMSPPGKAFFVSNDVAGVEAL